MFDQRKAFERALADVAFVCITSTFVVVELRWYFLFPVGFSVYFAVIASKNLQKSSAIQNISVTLSSVIIAIFVCNCLFISPLKLQRISLIIKFIDTYNSSNSRYLDGLQKNINPSVDEEQAIEMLAQHMITRPIFDALFKEYQFVHNNVISRSMQSMIETLQGEGFEMDTEVLDKFYTSVKNNVSNIDNLEGKQTIIKNCTLQV